jgi:hypothetical protein
MLRRAFRDPAVQWGTLGVSTAVREKHIKMPDPNWDPVHEDINEHVKKRVPGETRLDRVKRFARE